MATEKEWEAFLARFERCELARPEWTHSAHLAVATIYVSRHPVADALTRTRDGILRLNAHFGVPQTRDGGYHETLTVFFVQLIAELVAAPGVPTSLDGRIRLVTERLADKHVVLDWYGRERINSWEARTSWVEPDRRPLPRASSGERATTFQLGLVLAGAVSGGAYTAGVLDFLFEALDELARAKREGRADAPSHDVSVRVLTGTSAGAMCAGLAVQSLLHREAASPLYAAWVKRISLRALLETEDLPARGGVAVSLLDSTVLDAIAGDLLRAPTGRSAFPGYVSPRLDIGLCTAQLRGVPYTIGMNAPGRYGMRLHAVERWFRIGAGLGAAGWDPSAPPADGWWDELRRTCIASGAFPLGLAPRLLRLPRAEIEAREWPVPGPDGGENREIEPDWPDDVGRDFASYHVDGGLFDNEPLELARTVLSGSRFAHNPRSGPKVDRAVVMVDPFLEVGVDPAPEEPPGIFSALGQLAGAMVQNARFKPDELVLALDENVFSRFLVAPTRTTGHGGHEVSDPYALASGVLGAFGGFLSEAFREHDYRLGRRNCQRFLQRAFVLPVDTDVVRGWSPAAIAAHEFEERGRRYRRLIPLYGRAAVEQPLPRWPVWSDDDAAALHDGLARRGEVVVPALVRHPVVSTLLQAGWLALGWLGRGKIEALVTAQLRERRLAR